MELAILGGTIAAGVGAAMITARLALELIITAIPQRKPKVQA